MATTGIAPKLSARHDLNDSALGSWLQSNSVVPNLKLPVISTKIGYGQSNPTYFVDDAAYVEPAPRIMIANDTGQRPTLHSAEEATGNDHLACGAPGRPRVSSPEGAGHSQGLPSAEGLRTLYGQ